jgi:hypothetical protein
MIVLVTLTFGLVVWIVAWSFGIKAFDAFLFTALVAFVAAAVTIALPFVKQILTGKPTEPATPGEH